MLDPHDTVPLRSDLLTRSGFRHAFFTRRGGVSATPFNSLNFGTGTASCEDVQENTRRAARALGVPRSRIYLASQVHGRTSRVLSATDEREAVAHEPADALISASPGLACCLRVADCVPVLVGDRRSGAVVAVHSGWRGTVANVVDSSISALRDTIGDVGDLVASIGPHIGPCCFEVQPEVADQLAACGCPRAITFKADRAHVDLRMIVRAQLERTGVSECDDVCACTSCDPERFFSYRRDREKSGRMLAAIVAGRRADPSAI